MGEEQLTKVEILSKLCDESDISLVLAKKKKFPI